jgi:hypothetical protein
MPLYQIEAPDGKTYEIEGPPGATKEQVAQAVIAKLGRVPEPQTVGGHVKELFKGPIPGAIGALESAVTGAAAMLPEGAEQAVRGVASKTAAALKAPFAAAPGYEDAYSRKVGEGVGSVLPYLAAGPFGAAGRVAASGVAVAQGAGEARTRAEQDGATDEQRRMATLAGAPVGLLEMAPVERMFRTLGEPIKRAVVDRVKRAMSTGGIEAAQEAASSALQNLIAQNVYKPEQEIVEGVGEAAGVGAGTGVLVQGLLDLALGKRAGRGAGAPTGEDKTKRDAILAELRAQEEAQQQQTAQQEAAKASPQYLVEQSAKLQALEEQQAALKAQLNPKPETALDRATNADIKRQLQELGAEAKQIATEIAPRRAELAELQRVQAEAEQARTEQAAAAAQGTAAAPVDNAAPGVMAYPPGTQMGLDGSAVVARPTPSTQPTTEEALRQRLSLEQQERALHAHLQDVDQEISIAAQERDIDLLDRLVQGRGQTAQALSAAQEQLRGMPPPPPTEARSDPLERLYKQLQKAGEEGDTDRVATLVAKIKAAGAAPAQPQTLDLLSKENMRATEDANARLQPRPPLSASDRAMMLERQSDAAANNEALLGVSRQDALRQQIMDARSQALDPNRAQGLLAGQRNETNDDLLAQGRERGATREVAEREARKQAFEARTMSTSVVEQGLLPFADAQGQQPKTRDDLLADLKEARKAKDITAAQRAIDALRKQADAARTPPTLASALYKYQQGTATKDDSLDALQKLPRAEQERLAEALPYSQIWLGDTAQAAYHAAKELGLKAPPPRGEATRGIQGQLSQAVPADVMQKQQTGAAPTVERVSTATVAYPYTAQPTPPPSNDATEAIAAHWLEPASLAGEARVRTNKTVPQARAQLRAEKDAGVAQRETNQRNSALETMRTGLPGELVEFQGTAREQLARALDGIDEKIAAKEADAADETLPKTTRDKRNRDLGVLRTLKDIAGDATTGDAESIQRAVDAARTERQTLADKMAKQNASYLEAKEAVDAARRADTKESTPETTAALEAAVKLRDSRMRERNKTRRSLAHFDAVVGSLSSAPKRTTLLTAEERREEAERANRVVPGTRLAPRVIGPTVREQSAAPGVMRTGELLTAGARAAPPQRPITQAGRRKGVSAKQAVAQANKDVEIEQLTLELQEREALKEKAQAALAKAKTPEAKAKYTEFTQRLQRRINTIEVRLEELETAGVGPSTTAQRAAKEADGEIQYSKEPSGGGMTAQQFQQELKGSGLELNPRKVTVVDSVNDLPTALRDRVVKESRDGAVPTAFVYKDRAYFIAGNIGKGKALSKVLHEIGAHLGMENILSAAQRDVLVNKVLEWAARNDGSAETRIAKAAVARVVAAGVDADQRSDEIVAYFIEEAVNAGVKPTALPSGQATGGWSAARWLRTVYAAFKAAVRRLGWMNADGLQAQHVVDMAYGAARLELSGTWHGTAAQFRKFNHNFMGSGEGAQAFGWGTYLAQSLGIAKGYWVADVRRKDAKNYEDAQETVRQLKAELGQLEERDRMGEGVEEDLGAKRKSLAEAVAYAGGLTKPEGALMRVDVLVDQDEMLDWDKPLSEQSETVKDALPPALVKEHGSKTGKDVYRYYAGNMDSTRSYKEASKKLYAMGIKGVKVLDAKSRELPGELRAAQTRVARLQKSAGAAQAKIARDGAPDGTWHAENFADLHAAEAALREVEQRMSEATRNLVVFNDKDIVRVASLRGADKERVQFSKEPGNPVEDLAGVLLATKKPLKGRIAVNLGLAGRTQAVDALAPIEAVAQSQMESLQGLQVMYDSRMYGQRSAFTARVMNHGPLEYATKKRDDGRTETLIESREGPTLRMVAQTLAEGPLGDADKANRYFSVYTIAQRAKRVGLDRLDLSGGVTQPMIDAAMAEIKATPGLEQNFKDAYALYNAYNKGLIRFLEKSGAVSKDSAAKMLASNDYVPFYRERGGNVELLIGGEAPIRIGNMKDQPTCRSYVGATRRCSTSSPAPFATPHCLSTLRCATTPRRRWPTACKMSGWPRSARATGPWAPQRCGSNTTATRTTPSSTRTPSASRRTCW